MTERLCIQHPEIAKEWHKTKNGDLTLNDLTAGSHKKVLWQYSKFKHHEWDAPIATRSKRKTGCLAKPFDVEAL